MNLSDISPEENCCEVDDNLRIIRGIRLFSGLPLELLRLLAYLSTRDGYQPQDMLCDQGDDAGRAFYIISGSLSLVHAEDQQEQILKRYQAGDFIGGLSLLGTSQRLFGLRAETESQCLVLTRDKFEKAMQQYPEQIPRMIQSVVKEISHWEKQFLSGDALNQEACQRYVGISMI